MESLTASKPTAYVTHSDCSRHDTGWKHPDHQGRLPAVARAVHRDMLTLFDRLVEIEGVPATARDLCLAHTAGYIEEVRVRCAQAAAAGKVLPFGDELMLSPASWEAALAAVGCVATAVERVSAGEAANAFCAVRPPGHGAHADGPGAFGVFNSVAVATFRLLQDAEIESVWVVDLGSRPGSGTAAILGGATGARVVAVHSAAAEAPDTRSGGIITRPLAPGSGGEAMLEALQSALDEARNEAVPDFVLLSLGCDALAADPLGTLSLEPRDYYALTHELVSWAEGWCGGRLVSVLEEGYDAPATAQAVVQHLRALTGLAPYGE